MDDLKAHGCATEVHKWSLPWDEVYSVLKAHRFQGEEQ